MNPEEKSAQFIDDTYVLHELVDELKSTNESAEKAILSQRELIKAIKASDSELLKDLPGALEKQLEVNEKAVKANEFRIDCLEKILAIINVDAKASAKERYIVSMMLEGLGIVNKEGLSVDERSEEKSDEE